MRASSAEEIFLNKQSLLQLKQTPTGCQRLCVNYALQLVYSRGCHVYTLVCTAPQVKVFISKQNSWCWNKLSSQSEHEELSKDALWPGADSHCDGAAVRRDTELWRGYRKCMVEQLEASLLGLVHFNLLHRDDEEGWMLNLSHYDECTDKLFNTIWPTSLNIQSTAVVSQGHCRYILSWSSPLCGSTHVPHTVYAVLQEPMPNNSIHLSVENRAPHIHTHPVNPKTAHVDSQ